MPPPGDAAGRRAGVRSLADLAADLRTLVNHAHRLFDGTNPGSAQVQLVTYASGSAVLEALPVIKGLSHAVPVGGAFANTSSITSQRCGVRRWPPS